MDHSKVDLDDLIFHCEDSGFIPACMYGRILELNPESSGEGIRDTFLSALSEVMHRGRLRFLGEGWVRNGVGAEAPLMFGDVEFGPEDTIVAGLRQPEDATAEGVVELIRKKWPPDVVPAFNGRVPGFDRLWFEKWEFEWVDATAPSVDA